MIGEDAGRVPSMCFNVGSHHLPMAFRLGAWWGRGSQMEVDRRKVLTPSSSSAACYSALCI